MALSLSLALTLTLSLTLARCACPRSRCSGSSPSSSQAWAGGSCGRCAAGDGDAASCVGVWAVGCALEKGPQRREAHLSLDLSPGPPSDIVVLSDLTLDLRVVSTFHEERHSPYASCFCKGQFSDYIQARGIHCTSNRQSTVQTLTAPRASTLQSSGTSPELRVRTRRAGDERGA